MKKNLHYFINANSLKNYWKEIVAVLMLLLAIFFFRAERKEIVQIIPQISHSNTGWLLAGFSVTLLYIFCQAAMYVMSFRAVGIRYNILNATELFLKRNFLSVFLPAGGVSSLIYMPPHLRKLGISSVKVQQASILYAFVGFCTLVLVGMPIITIAFLKGAHINNAWLVLILLTAFLLALISVFVMLKNKTGVYPFIQKKIPWLAFQIHELLELSPSAASVLYIISISLLVELCGMMHIIIALKALGLQPNLMAVALGYTLSVVLMVASPFLRGLGIVELTLAAALGWYGISKADSLSATILYRVFEFWLPLAAGVLLFSWKGRWIFIRIFPLTLIFLLGIVNIVSVVTPPLAERVRLLHGYIPYSTIHASNLLVFLVGLMLLVNAAFLLKGLKSAWWFAFTLSVLSLIGHLTKALDWEEAIFAFITALFLLISYKQYRIKNNRQLAGTGLAVTLFIFLSVTIFGYTAFYFIDTKHFGIDFTWKQSLIHTFNIFILVKDDALQPKTHFGYEFIWLLRSLGVFAWGFLFYTIIRPFINLRQEPDDKQKATGFIEQFGVSATDYFKVMADKRIFFSPTIEGFVSYRVANNFAIVLEEPVCKNGNKITILKEFDIFCKKAGLISVFYRVNENSISFFNQLKKKKILIGQEAIIDLKQFSLEGKDKKALRNALNGLQKKGYVTEVCTPPYTAAFMTQLKNVSDEWLIEFDKKEMIFSQGMFDYRLLQEQDIIVIRNENKQLVSFLNIIPDYAPGECTYDLIRKTTEAPGGCMDALIIALIEYAKQRKLDFLNLGMVPLSGIEEPGSLAEKIMSYAYRNVKRFSHYKGLRFFKEKYASFWENKYLVYEHEYDLLQLPIALAKVMQP